MLRNVPIEMSGKMANMSVVAAFMVVVLHAGEPTVVGSSGWWWAEVCKMVSKVAVPYFFVAPGFFLAGHEGENGWWRKEVSKRIRSLFVPFVLWCLIWWFFYLPFGIYADYLHSRPFGYSLSIFEGKWIKILGLNLFQCPFYSPMWFLRALFLMVIMSPAISYMAKVWGGGGVILIFIAYWLMAPDARRNDEWRWFFRHGVSLFGMFWFALGMYLRKRMRDWTDLYPWGVWGAVASIGIAMSLLAGSIAAHFSRFDMSISLEPFFVLFALYGGFFFVSSSKWADILTNNSFPVYLIHSFFIFIIGFVLKNQDSWAILSARVLFAFVISLCAAFTIKKLSPRFATMLFGGR